MKKISIQMAMTENVVTLSEINQKKISLKKILDNWFLLVVLTLAAYTLRIAAEEMAMKARAATAVARER